MTTDLIERLRYWVQWLNDAGDDGSRMRADIDAAADAISQAEGEAVAWRWREKPEDRWQLQDGQPRDWVTRLGYQVEPLFAHPLPGWNEAVEEAAEDEELVDVFHAELVRQGAFSIEKHGKIALAMAPFIDAALAAIQRTLKRTP